VNAAVRFDEETLSPLYIVDVGVPGRSHALDVAGRYGIPESIIDSARQSMGGSGGRLEPLLAQLEQLRQQAEKDREVAARDRADADRTRKRLNGELSKLNRRRQEILGEANREARGLVREVRGHAAALLRQIRSTRTPATAQETEIQAGFRNLDRDLNEQSESLQREAEQETDGSGERLEPGEMQPGRRVKVRSLALDGELLQIHPTGGRCRVRVGSMEVEVALTDLSFASDPVPKAPAARVRFEGTDSPVSSELKLIGKRVDPALDELDRFLDRATLAGLLQIRIIHGIGTGALGKAVREFLKDHIHCETFRAGTPAEGGDGATVVNLAPHR